jgi:hypothetical protein
MIYRLMKLDGLWRAAWVVGATALLVSFGKQTGWSVLLIPIPGLYVLVLFGASGRIQPMLAGLPVRARDSFLARLLTALILLWVPVPFEAAIQAFRASGDFELALSVKTQAFLTVGFLLLWVCGVERFNTPLPPKTTLVGFYLLTGICGFVPLLPFLTACLLVGMGLFLIIWTRIPESFQIAPHSRESIAAGVAAAAASSPIETRSWPPMPWSPVFHSVLGGPRFLIAIPLLFGGGLSRDPLWSFGGVTILYVLSERKTRWLASLPFSTHALLSIYLIPCLIPLFAGYFLRAYASRIPFSVLIVDLTFMMASILLPLLAFALLRWRRFKPASQILGAAICPVLAWLNYRLFKVSLEGNARVGEGPFALDILTRQVIRILPDHPALLAAGLYLSLVALYLVLHKALSEGEWADKTFRVPLEDERS